MPGTAGTSQRPAKGAIRIWLWHFECARLGHSRRPLNSSGPAQICPQLDKGHRLQLGPRHDSAFVRMRFFRLSGLEDKNSVAVFFKRPSPRVEPKAASVGDHSKAPFSVQSPTRVTKPFRYRLRDTRFVAKKQGLRTSASRRGADAVGRRGRHVIIALVATCQRLGAGNTKRPKDSILGIISRAPCGSGATHNGGAW